VSARDGADPRRVLDDLNADLSRALSLLVERSLSAPLPDGVRPAVLALVVELAKLQGVTEWLASGFVVFPSPASAGEGEA